MFSRLGKFLLACVTAAFVHNAAAVPISYDFTANFNTGPYSNISGQVTLDGTTVTDIDLTIAGHIFTLGEVGAQSWSGLNILVGGLLSGLNTMTSNTNDFWLVFNPLDPSAGAPFFAYTFNDGNRFFHNSTSVDIAVAVPEPGSVALVALSLGLLGVASRRRINA